MGCSQSRTDVAEVTDTLPGYVHARGYQPAPRSYARIRKRFSDDESLDPIASSMTTPHVPTHPVPSSPSTLETPFSIDQNGSDPTAGSREGLCEYPGCPNSWYRDNDNGFGPYCESHALESTRKRSSEGDSPPKKKLAKNTHAKRDVFSPPESTQATHPDRTIELVKKAPEEHGILSIPACSVGEEYSTPEVRSRTLSDDIALILGLQGDPTLDIDDCGPVPTNRKEDDL